MIPRVLLRIGVLGLAGVLISGCVTTVDHKQASSILGSIEQGTLMLECGVPCAFDYGTKRSRLRTHWQNGNHEAVGLAVGTSGHHVNQAFYYLGWVAQQRGYPTAAEKYYRYALSALRCDAFLDNCDGLDIPALVNKGLGEVAAMTAKRTRQPSTPSRQHQAANNVQPEREKQEAKQKPPAYMDLRYLDSRTNLRAGPGTGHDVLGVLARGSKVKAAKANGEWRAVRTDAGDEGYIFARLLLSEDDYASRQAARATVARQSQEAPKPAPAEPVSSEPAPAADQATAPPVAIAPSLMLIDPPWKAGSGDQLTFAQAGPTIIIGRIVGEATKLVINDRPVPLKAGGFFQAEVDVAAGETFRYALHYGNDQDVSSEISVKIE